MGMMHMYIINLKKIDNTVYKRIKNGVSRRFQIILASLHDCQREFIKRHWGWVDIFHTGDVGQSSTHSANVLQAISCHSDSGCLVDHCCMQHCTACDCEVSSSHPAM